MNGVCVQWKGRINLEKLDGIGCLEFDEERAMVRYIISLTFNQYGVYQKQYWCLIVPIHIGANIRGAKPPQDLNILHHNRIGT